MAISQTQSVVQPATSRLLRPDSAVLLMVDIQEKFLPVLPNAASLVERAGILIELCEKLEIPIVVSEQYTKGLGHTAAALSAKLPASASIFEKAAFGCGEECDISGRLAELNRPQVIVCGIETHICVNQSVHQLLCLGYQVHVVQDAVSSRFARDHEIGLAKMQQSGAIPTGVEMVLFELLQTSLHPLFKPLQALVK